jgi:hypothetical protein
MCLKSVLLHVQYINGVLHLNHQVPYLKEVTMKNNNNKNKKAYQGRSYNPNRVRATAASPVFKVPYGEPKPVSCKRCEKGVLRPTQWNRLCCSSIACNYSELS